MTYGMISLLSWFCLENTLVDKRASEILNLINYAKEFVGKPISVYDALDIAKAIQSIQLPSSKLDIGKISL